MRQQKNRRGNKWCRKKIKRKTKPSVVDPTPSTIEPPEVHPPPVDFTPSYPSPPYLTPYTPYPPYPTPYTPYPPYPTYYPYPPYPIPYKNTLLKIWDACMLYCYLHPTNDDAAWYAHFDLLKNWLDRIEIIFNE